MPCLNPTPAWKTGRLTQNGKPEYSFTYELGKVTSEQENFPCGKCPYCRERKVATKTNQCINEFNTSVDNCFITLTYNDENLPVTRLCPTGTLNKKHLTKFHKDLRKYIERQFPDNPKYKYFQCGEYGSSDNTQRPHYHMLIMGFNFPDRQLQGKFQSRNQYTSQLLEKLWPYGFVQLEDATSKAAGYIAKYAAKELLAGKINQDTLETTGKIPQFVSQSQNIGKDYLTKYQKELLIHDSVVRDGLEIKLNSYQLDKLESLNPERVEELKQERREYAQENQNSTYVDDLTEQLSKLSRRESNTGIKSDLRKWYEKELIAAKKGYKHTDRYKTNQELAAKREKLNHIKRRKDIKELTRPVGSLRDKTQNQTS